MTTALDAFAGVGWGVTILAAPLAPPAESDEWDSLFAEVAG
ncbi:hypothetical protein [Leucobacter sp. NPDC077196]